MSTPSAASTEKPRPDLLVGSPGLLLRSRHLQQRTDNAGAPLLYRALRALQLYDALATAASVVEDLRRHLRP